MLDSISHFRESRLIEGFVRPYCHSRAVIRWGQERLPVRQVKLSQRLAGAGITAAPPTHGLQYYRCKDYGKTFNDHTGSPLARTKRLDNKDALRSSAVLVDEPAISILSRCEQKGCGV